MKYGGARIKTALVYLNNVEEGGGTRMSKLNKTITPNKGKLLVFTNTYNNTNERHFLAEHAGMPVLKGEKYIFNLWFKECKSTTLYSDFNPSYYANIKPQEQEKEQEKEQEQEQEKEQEQYQHQDDICNKIKLHTTKEIYRIPSLLNNNDLATIISKCKFDNSSRKSAWVKLKEVPNIVKKLESITGITSNFYENINVIEYEYNMLHNKHFVAYDLTTEKGKGYTSKLGQRIHTLSLILSNNINIDFPDLKLNTMYAQGDCLFYTNVTDKNSRDHLYKEQLLIKKKELWKEVKDT